jgi:hypothetical protein
MRRPYKLPHTIDNDGIYHNGCIEYRWAKPGRYGQLYISGESGGPSRPIGAHRFYYEMINGPVDESLDIDHLCRNPRCINPEHLEAVTHSENLRRASVWEKKTKYPVSRFCPTCRVEFIVPSAHRQSQRYCSFACARGTQRRGNAIPIVQYSTDGEVVKVWPSFREAVLALHVAPRTLHNACNNGKQVLGSVWGLYHE